MRGSDRLSPNTNKPREERASRAASTPRSLGTTSERVDGRSADAGFRQRARPARRQRCLGPPPASVAASMERGPRLTRSPVGRRRRRSRHPVAQRVGGVTTPPGGRDASGPGIARAEGGAPGVRSGPPHMRRKQKRRFSRRFITAPSTQQRSTRLAPLGVNWRFARRGSKADPFGPGFDALEPQRYLS